MNRNIKLLLGTIGLLAAMGLILTLAGGGSGASQPVSGGMPDPSPGPSWIRVLGAYAFVLGLLGIMAYLAKRFGGRLPGMPGQSGSLRVESRMPLGGRQSLVVVCWEGRRYLLGVGTSGVTLVGRDSDAPTVPTAASPSQEASPPADPPGFLESLRRQMGKNS